MSNIASKNSESTGKLESISNNQENKAGAPIQLKIAFNGELRRVSCANSFAAVHAAVAALAGAAASLVLSYQDDEGDRVTLATDAELAEALRVASGNGVLRIQAEQRGATAAVAAPAAPAAPAPAAASIAPLATSAPTTLTAEEAAFWTRLPAWLQSKIIARSGEQQAAVAQLPASDAAHFACLSAETRADIRARAEAHAEHRRAKLVKKEVHHREAAAQLHEKAQRLLEKAAEQERVAALKKAKLDGVDTPIDNDDDEEEENTEKTTVDDATLWARVPVHIKARIVARWLPTPTPPPADSLDAVAVFASLPVHVQQRVRARAARFAERDGEASDERRCHRRHGNGGDSGRHCEGRGARHGWWRAQAVSNGDMPTPPVTPFAGAAFENAPHAVNVPKPQL